ncbi:MAG: glutathione S-transferase [Methyloceanibacter sp.]|jgi:glutathione S-transferase
MPARFGLYYWPIPFRAQSIRYILAYAGEAWDEPDLDEVTALYQSPVLEQPVPFMGPPILHDRQDGVWLSQAPAIAGYVGEAVDLMPGTATNDALTQKVLSDCIDVLHALTQNCGALMWTKETWSSFAEHRLPRWLQIFEELGARNALKADSGTLLGTPKPGVADLACASLWVTIWDLLPQLRQMIGEHAPNVLSLSQRIAGTDAIRAMRTEQDACWGNVWCEGEIERSLRTALSDWRSSNAQ